MKFIHCSLAGCNELYKLVKMLHCAVIEVRRNLRCANVFLQFNECFVDPNSLKINVDEMKIRLQNPKCEEILVNNYFGILTETFSNLVIDTENASFRIGIKDIQLAKESKSNDRINIHLNLSEEDNETTLQCSNCEAVLVVGQKYEKIREFPSGAIDVSEFFCHHGSSLKDVLIPNIKDLFYGFEFIVVNIAIIEKSIHVNENHLYCKKCLRYLGEVFNSKAAKLWSDSIRFKSKGEIIEIFASNTKSKIQKLMFKAIEESSLPSPEPLLKNMHFTKVLLEASFPNRQQQYLLVHILEKELPILRNKERNDIKHFKAIELEQNKAFKILFRLIAMEVSDNCESSKWPPLLEYWQQDINILKMKISPFLFIALNEELNNNILILPEIYRIDKDGFLLSYIFY